MFILHFVKATFYHFYNIPIITCYLYSLYYHYLIFILLFSFFILLLFLRLLWGGGTFFWLVFVGFGAFRMPSEL